MIASFGCVCILFISGDYCLLADGTVFLPEPVMRQHRLKFLGLLHELFQVRIGVLLVLFDMLSMIFCSPAVCCTLCDPST